MTICEQLPNVLEKQTTIEHIYDTYHNVTISDLCYALTGRSSRREVSESDVDSGLSALATCDADMW